MSYPKKMAVILSVFVLLGLLFFIYKRSIFEWSCRNEQVYSSCYIVGMYEQEAGNQKVAVDFYKMACNDGKYALACLKLAEHFEKTDHARKELFQKRACKIDRNIKCEGPVDQAL